MQLPEDQIEPALHAASGVANAARAARRRWARKYKAKTRRHHLQTALQNAERAAATLQPYAESFRWHGDAIPYKYHPRIMKALEVLREERRLLRRMLK